jgi:predicted nucleotidyltransferase
MRATDVPFVLVRRTARSFATNDPAALISWLADTRGYTPVPPCGAELARLKRRGAIVCIWRTGSVLCQGARAESAVALLARYADGEEVQP